MIERSRPYPAPPTGLLEHRIETTAAVVSIFMGYGLDSAPRPPMPWKPATMHQRQDDNRVADRTEVHGVRKATHERAPSVTLHTGIGERILRSAPASSWAARAFSQCPGPPVAATVGEMATPRALAVGPRPFRPIGRGSRQALPDGIGHNPRCRWGRVRGILRSWFACSL